MKLKYIMYNMEGTMIPILFAPVLVHKDMDEFNSLLLRRKYRLHAEIVSAGFYDCTSRVTYGESESLDLQSRPEDADIIHNQPSYVSAVDQAYNWRR